MDDAEVCQKCWSYIPSGYMDDHLAWHKTAETIAPKVECKFAPWDYDTIDWFCNTHKQEIPIHSLWNDPASHPEGFTWSNVQDLINSHMKEHEND